MNSAKKAPMRVCHLCLAEFGTLKDLQNHVSSDHGGIKHASFNCLSYCDFEPKCEKEEHFTKNMSSLLGRV